MPGRKTCGNTRLSKLTFAFHPKTWGLSDDLARSQDLDRMIEAQRIEDQRFFEVQRMQEQLDAILRALQDIQKYQLEGTTTPSVAYWKLG